MDYEDEEARENNVDGSSGCVQEQWKYTDLFVFGFKLGVAEDLTRNCRLLWSARDDISGTITSLSQNMWYVFCTVVRIKIGETGELVSSTSSLDKNMERSQFGQVTMVTVMGVGSALNDMGLMRWSQGANEEDFFLSHDWVKRIMCLSGSGNKGVGTYVVWWFWDVARDRAERFHCTDSRPVAGLFKPVAESFFREAQSAGFGNIRFSHCYWFRSFHRLIYVVREAYDLSGEVELDIMYILGMEQGSIFFILKLFTMTSYPDKNPGSSLGKGV
ncbi:hypothetical protein YC2023_099804 [Brassica napus]